MNLQTYPPHLSAGDFSGIPERDRADAIQEAWVAYLEFTAKNGTDDVASVAGALSAMRAAWRYRGRERREAARRTYIDIDSLCESDIKRKW
jgi:hypothetical protein